MLKYEIKKFAIQCSKGLAKTKRAKIESLIKCISDITLNMLGDDGDVPPQLYNHQQDLDEFYKERKKLNMERNSLSRLKIENSIIL